MDVINIIKSFLLLNVLIWGISCTDTEANTAPTYDTAVVIEGDLSITVEATGNIEPIRKVEVKSKASGEVVGMRVDVGDEVGPGALLARIDPRDVQNGFDQAKADLEVAKARLDISGAQKLRSEELLSSGVISLQEHESNNLDYANAQANLVKAETNYELNELRLSDVTIRAPSAGTILEKNVEEGQVIQSASQNVSGGTTLVIMADLGLMQVRTLVDETDMGDVESGMTSRVTVEAYPGRPFVGLVEKIEPQAVVEQSVTMFPVIVQLDNQSGLLKPGMNAEVEILINEAPGVHLIPNNAVVTPQDAPAAASILGLDPQDIDIRSLFSNRAGRGGGRAQGERGARPGNSEAEPGNTNRPRGPVGAEVDSLRSKVQRGEISQDSARTLIQNRVAGRGRAPQDPDLVAARGSTNEQGRSSVPERPGIVFKILSDGSIEPQLVQLGLNDWDFTQVMSGLNVGDELAIVGAAQLRAGQDEFLNRIRSRSGGGMFGGGR